MRQVHHQRAAQRPGAWRGRVSLRLGQLEVWREGAVRPGLGAHGEGLGEAEAELPPLGRDAVARVRVRPARGVVGVGAAALSRAGGRHHPLLLHPGRAAVNIVSTQLRLEGVGLAPQLGDPGDELRAARMGEHGRV